MFSLVNDIESYPEFLPWCRAARILSHSNDEIKATIELARGGLHKNFTTCNRYQKDKMIEMRLVEGPFSHLEGFWRFDPLDADSCKTSLDLEFEISNKLLKLTLGPIFTQITNSLVDSFSRRAEAMFGKHK